MFRSIFFGKNETPDSPRCGICKHFNNDPVVLEKHFKGINSLSSVYGSTRGDGGICGLHNRYLLPVHSCSEFRLKESGR